MRHELATIAIVLLSTPALAEPFPTDPKDFPSHIQVPLPPQTESRAQAAIEQRAKDIESGAATVWGTAQADLLIKQLRESGVLPHGNTPEGDASSAPTATLRDPSGPVSTSEKEAEQAGQAKAEFPTLLLDLDEDRLRIMLERLYTGLSDERLHESTLTFRKHPNEFMRDAILVLAAMYSMAHDTQVDWNSLHTKVDELLINHRSRVANLFVNALKAAARTQKSETNRTTPSNVDY